MRVSNKVYTRYDQVVNYIELVCKCIIEGPLVKRGVKIFFSCREKNSEIWLGAKGTGVAGQLSLYKYHVFYYKSKVVAHNESR